MSLFQSTSETVRHLISRLEKRLRRRVEGKRRRSSKQRRLRTEPLESRQLLAADLHLFQHNHFDAEDVNDDGFVSPVDVLMVVNSINANTPQDRLNFIDVDNDGVRTPRDALMVINRLNRAGQSQEHRNSSSRSNRGAQTNVPDLPSEIRSIDGTGNNVQNPDLGSAGSVLLRAAEADYADGISIPAGQDRPSAREISNVLSEADPVGTRNDQGLSAFIYVWGQFLDHDIDHSGTPTEGGESFDISVPAGDMYFDPMATGEETIEFTRSEFALGTGTSVDNPRQQFNTVTSYIDGSMVYGSDDATAAGLRAFEGGRLLMTGDGLLPIDDSGDVVAGDSRAGENIALTSLQTLFAREHNRLAGQIASQDSLLEDEEIYQQARAIVIAEIQAITYNEFLPALLGNRAISQYDGYDRTVDPTITTEFSTAAFRFGHSTLNDDIEFFDNDGRAVLDGISLAEAFNNPSLLEETGIDSLLKYEASTQAQEVDLQVVDSLRNLLFGPPGAGGMDLVALNIQRGRDHGLSDYNSTREAYGLQAVDSFADITSDAELQADLESLYGTVDNIDLWVGLLAEDHVRGASVGELTQNIIVDQFERLRDGDRFWYENIYSGSELRQLQAASLADVIERNTNVVGLQENVFFMLAEVSGRVAEIPSDVSSTANPPTGTALAGANSVGNQRQRTGSSQSRFTGLEGIEVELLGEDGEVLATTFTDKSGNYRFGIDSIHETGDYQVRLVDSDALEAEAIDFLVSNGKTRLRGLDFAIRLA